MLLQLIFKYLKVQFLITNSIKVAILNLMEFVIMLRCISIVSSSESLKGD